LVDKNRLDEIRSRDTSNSEGEILYNLAIIKNSLVESYPQDKAAIEMAYKYARDYVSGTIFMINKLYFQYKDCKKIKDAPPNMMKVYFAEIGFNFDDLDGSFEKLKLKIGEENIIKYQPKYDQKLMYYYEKLLRSREV